MSKLLPLSAAQNLFDELMSRQPDKSGPKRSQATNIVNWYAIHREGKPFNDADRDDYIAHDGNRKTRVSEWSMVRLYLRNGSPAYDTKTTRAARDVSGSSITGKLLAHPSVTAERRADILEAQVEPIPMIRGIQPSAYMAKYLADCKVTDPKRLERALYIAVMTGFGPRGTVYDDPDAKQAIEEFWDVPELDRKLSTGHFMGGIDHADELHKAIHERIDGGRWGFVAYHSLLANLRMICCVHHVTTRTEIKLEFPGFPPKMPVYDMVARLDDIVKMKGISTIDDAREKVADVDHYDRCVKQWRHLTGTPELSLLS